MMPGGQRRGEGLRPGGRGRVGVAVPYFAFIVQFILPTTGRVCPERQHWWGRAPRTHFATPLPAGRGVIRAGN